MGQPEAEAEVEWQADDVTFEGRRESIPVALGNKAKGCVDIECTLPASALEG